MNAMRDDELTAAVVDFDDASVACDLVGALQDSLPDQPDVPADVLIPDLPAVAAVENTALDAWNSEFEASLLALTERRARLADTQIGADGHVSLLHIVGDMEAVHKKTHGSQRHAPRFPRLFCSLGRRDRSSWHSLQARFQFGRTSPCALCGCDGKASSVL